MDDLIVRGGTVVDGTGAPPRRADVSVRDGKITAVGDLQGVASRAVIDAEGALVTPGFVDLHTHYDGQLTWDRELLPSAAHGVTTCTLGNCGVGFAPCRERDREDLIGLMEGVEDIPGSALSEGIKWRWQTFGEYMDALEREPHTLDFALQVPHDALRVWVMGPRALAGEASTEDDVTALQALLREALTQGAVGFSTGRTDNHRARSGAATPAAEADQRELLALARAFRGLGHGVLQAVSDFNLGEGPEPFDGEFDLLEAMAREAPGHPMSISLMQRDQAPDQWKRILARVERAEARERLGMRVQVAPRGIGVLLGLQATFHPFMGFPSYKAVASLPLPERVSALRDPALRQRLLGEKSDRVAGDGSAIPPVADWLLAQMDQIAFRIFRLGEVPDYEPPASASLGAQARARGVPVLEAVLDALLENNGQELLYFPIYNYAAMNLGPVREMLGHPQALPGLSDGGAHVGTICDASFPTFLLQHWARDRATDRLSVERAVQMLTQDTSRHLGLRDRGALAPGLKGDINVIDFAQLGLSRPRLVADLPAGGKRLLQDARGYRCTIVSGTPIAREGALTGALPGRLVRGGH
ncbi:MAG: amidohydrolase family protein [Deltaproteobacteria bacterium]|nr:amidohydrolase family protein [Deltaproteobacteria bacterium]